jgi:RimJ/RimL family protein N-acetyltransferase
VSGRAPLGKTGCVRWSPPDPPLRTDRVVLRPFRIGDAAEVAAACTDPDIVRFTFMQEGLTEVDAQKWIEQANEWWPHGHARFAIVDSADDRVLGQVGMAVNEHLRSAEAYYWVSPTARRRCVASRALGLIADWAFDEGVERLFLLIHPRTNHPTVSQSAWDSAAKEFCGRTSRSKDTDRTWSVGPCYRTTRGHGTHEAGAPKRRVREVHRTTSRSPS